MKTLNINIYLDFGQECTGLSHGLDDDYTFQVSDETAAALAAALEDADDHREALEELAESNDELQKIVDQLDSNCTEAEQEYWIEEGLQEDVVMEAIRESAPDFGWEEPSFEDFCDEEEYEPEEDEDPDDCGEYEAWIYEQLEDWFRDQPLDARMDMAGIEIDIPLTVAEYTISIED